MPTKKKKYVDPKGIVARALYNRTLTAVNKMRKANGIAVLTALPPGIPEEPCNCPIARALAPIGVTEVNGSSILVKQKQLDGSTQLVEYEADTYAGDNDKADVCISGEDNLSKSMFATLELFADFVNEFDDEARNKLDRDEDKGWD